jgi:hypothetical protein
MPPTDAASKPLQDSFAMQECLEAWIFGSLACDYASYGSPRLYAHHLSFVRYDFCCSIQTESLTGLPNCSTSGGSMLIFSILCGLKKLMTSISSRQERSWSCLLRSYLFWCTSSTLDCVMDIALAAKSHPQRMENLCVPSL